MNYLTSLFSTSLTGLMNQVALFAPKIGGALLVLLIGYVAACLLKKVFISVAKKIGLDEFSKKLSLDEVLASLKIESALSVVLGKILYWIVFLVFINTAIQKLDLTQVSELFQSFIAFLPRALVAFLLLIIGVKIAQVIRNIATAAAEKIKMGAASTMGSVAYFLVLAMFGSVILKQLNLDVALVDRILQIALFTVGASVAIALGFGSRHLMKSILSGIYLRELIPVGSQVSIKGHIGKVLEFSSVSVKIKKEDGDELVLANSILLEEGIVFKA